MPMIYDPLGVPVQIGRGRGDLRFSSVPFAGNSQYGVPQVGKPNASFATIFATQPKIAAAVMRMLTWSVRVPLKLYRRTGTDSRERLRPGDHPLATALASPWPRGSQADLVMSLLGSQLVHGNGVTQVLSGAGDKIAFKPLDWRFSTPIMLEPDAIQGWEVTSIGETDLVGVQDILHVKWWSPLSILGISPLYQLGVTLQIEDAAQRWQVAMMANGARPPSAIMASDQWIGMHRDERQQMLANLREDITAIYSGPDNGGKPAVLPPGLDWKQVGHTAVEAELINQRAVNFAEVCAVYQIPPPMLGVYERATFNNIETARQLAYTDSLGPPLVLIEEAFNSQVIAGILHEGDIFAEFDFAGVLRGDRLKEIQALSAAIQTALMTPNEGRSVLNFPQSDDPNMNEFWMPANNFQPLGAIPTALEPDGELDVTSTDDALDTDNSLDDNDSPDDSIEDAGG